MPRPLQLLENSLRKTNGRSLLLGLPSGLTREKQHSLLLAFSHRSQALPAVLRFKRQLNGNELNHLWPRQTVQLLLISFKRGGASWQSPGSTAVWNGHFMAIFPSD